MSCCSGHATRPGFCSDTMPARRPRVAERLEPIKGAGETAEEGETRGGRGSGETLGGKKHRRGGAKRQRKAGNTTQHMLTVAGPATRATLARGPDATSSGGWVQILCQAASCAAFKAGRGPYHPVVRRAGLPGLAIFAGIPPALPISTTSSEIVEISRCFRLAGSTDISSTRVFGNRWV